MKKIYSVIFVLLAFILSVGCFSGFYSAFAHYEKENNLSINAKSGILLDYQTNTVIYSKNEIEHLPIASMCKIMTLVLCFEAIENNEISLSDSIIVSENASGMGGSQVFLENNGQYMVGELIKSIVVASANDACVAMAEKLCGSEGNFVLKMNEKAKELGMNDTVFVNCTGLPQAGQYSCAKDVSIMFRELLKYEDYYKFSRIWTDVVMHPKGRKTEISNTNKLIRFYKGCDSGKTGYTSEAGHCLSASAIRNGMRIICVVIGAPSSKERFANVSQMFNYSFANFENKKIIDKDKPIELKLDVANGKKDKLGLIPESSMYLFCEKHSKIGIEISFEPLKNICAPIKKGSKVGKLIAFENGVEIGSVNVLANETILEKSYFDNVKNIVNNWGII